MFPSSKDFKLAKIFLSHSLKLKSKEKVLIMVSDSAAFDLAKATYIEALKMGLYPIVDVSEIDSKIARSSSGGLTYQFFKLANKWQLNYLPKQILEAKISWADGFVRIGTIDNSKELAQINPSKISLRQKLMRPFLDKIVDSDRWVLTIFPTPSMAQDAGVSFDWLLDFYYKACVVDYQKMKAQLLKIQNLLDKGKKVEILGKKTQLTFSIEGRLSQACYGERNIPDGEVFLAPIENTLEGKIYFDMPTSSFGRDVEDIELVFEKGKVVKATAQKGQEALEKMLKTDKGACRVGEFAIGANYNIKRAMKNTLFDEKIGGTIHLALGRAYKEKRGGGQNQSAIHWDIVKDMRLLGSTVKIDGKIVQKDGKLD